MPSRSLASTYYDERGILDLNRHRHWCQDSFIPRPLPDLPCIRNYIYIHILAIDKCRILMVTLVISCYLFRNDSTRTQANQFSPFPPAKQLFVYTTIVLLFVEQRQVFNRLRTSVSHLNHLNHSFYLQQKSLLTCNPHLSDFHLSIVLFEGSFGSKKGPDCRNANTESVLSSHCQWKCRAKRIGDSPRGLVCLKSIAAVDQPSPTSDKRGDRKISRKILFQFLENKKEVQVALNSRPVNFLQCEHPLKFPIKLIKTFTWS